MKKKSLFALLAVIAFAFSSCHSDDNGYELKTQQTFTQCYAHFTSTSINGGSDVAASYNNSPVTVFLEVFYNNQTCNINISGMKRADGTLYPALTFKDVKWKANEQNWGICEELNPTVVSAVPADVPNITGLTFRWNNREKVAQTVHLNTLAVCEFSFTINGEYNVFGSQCEKIIAGETTSTAEGVSPFKTDYPIYTILLKFETMTADIRITNAKFAEAMPLMQMDFPNIPFIVSNNSNEVSFNAESLVPTIKGVPYPSFPITELSGKLEPTGKGNLKFNCGVRGVTYNVDANLDLLSLPNSDF